MPLHTHQDTREMHPSVYLKVGGLDPGGGHATGVAVKVAAAVVSVSLAERVESEKVSECPGGDGGAAQSSERSSQRDWEDGKERRQARTTEAVDFLLSVPEFH